MIFYVLSVLTIYSNTNIHVGENQTYFAKTNEFPMVLESLVLDNNATLHIPGSLNGDVLIQANYFEAGENTHIVSSLLDDYYPRIDMQMEQEIQKNASITREQPKLKSFKGVENLIILRPDKAAQGIDITVAGPCVHGTKGNKGDKGDKGRNSIRLTLKLGIAKINDLLVEITSGPGGHGGKGGTGQEGGRADCDITGCNGHDGGEGGDGGDGGDAGDIGPIILQWYEINGPIASTIDGFPIGFKTAYTQALPGMAGEPGNGGKGARGRECLFHGRSEGNGGPAGKIWGSNGKDGKVFTPQAKKEFFE